MKDMIQNLAKAFAHPDLKHMPSAGLNHEGQVVATMAQPNEGGLVVQRRVRKEYWSELDVLEPQRFLTLFIFGDGQNGFLAFAAAEYFQADHQPVFNAPGWNAGTDMLLMIATADNERDLASRVLGFERGLSLQKMLKNTMAPVLALAKAFEEHDFIDALTARAIARNRSRLYLHVNGKNNRFQQLVKGLGFTVTDHDDCTVFIKPVGN